MGRSGAGGLGNSGVWNSVRVVRGETTSTTSRPQPQNLTPLPHRPIPTPPTRNSQTFPRPRHRHPLPKHPDHPLGLLPRAFLPLLHPPPLDLDHDADDRLRGAEPLPRLPDADPVLARFEPEAGADGEGVALRPQRAEFGEEELEELVGWGAGREGGDDDGWG